MAVATKERRAVEQLEKELARAHDELCALQDEQAEDIEDRLKAEALAALESGDASALVGVRNRRKILPWLVWAAKVRVARLDGELKDARAADLAERARGFEDVLARDPRNERAARQLEDANLKRRMIGFDEDRRKRALRELEEAGPTS